MECPQQTQLHAYIDSLTFADGAEVCDGMFTDASGPSIAIEKTLSSRNFSLASIVPAS